MGVLRMVIGLRRWLKKLRLLRVLKPSGLMWIEVIVVTIIRRNIVFIALDKNGVFSASSKKSCEGLVWWKPSLGIGKAMGTLEEII